MAWISKPLSTSFETSVTWISNTLDISDKFRQMFSSFYQGLGNPVKHFPFRHLLLNYPALLIIFINKNRLDWKPSA